MRVSPVGVVARSTLPLPSHDRRSPNLLLGLRSDDAPSAAACPPACATMRLFQPTVFAPTPRAQSVVSMLSDAGGFTGRAATPASAAAQCLQHGLHTQMVRHVELYRRSDSCGGSFTGFWKTGSAAGFNCRHTSAEVFDCQLQKHQSLDVLSGLEVGGPTAQPCAHLSAWGPQLSGPPQGAGLHQAPHAVCNRCLIQTTSDSMASIRLPTLSAISSARNSLGFTDACERHAPCRLVLGSS